MEVDMNQASTCVNSSALASGSRVKMAGLPERLRVYAIPEIRSINIQQNKNYRLPEEAFL